MIDSQLATLLTTTMSFGALGSVVALVSRFLNRGTSGPGLGQSAAIGFLVGAAWGAIHGIFTGMISR